MDRRFGALRRHPRGIEPFSHFKIAAMRKSRDDVFRADVLVPQTRRFIRCDS